MEILIDNRSSDALDTDKVEALARFVLSQERAPEALELSISYVDAAEIQELNRAYRGKDAPTDVLSFECDDPHDPTLPGQPLSLGDVIICPTVAYEHAREFESTIEHEMALMLTHGILHLLGYDHLDDSEAAVMEARENDLLEFWFKGDVR
ncbi:MAG: rRNA maturation RNase YbeY [Coriobacteriales bacterium]|jgi:probable rRNA maturation factor|nr:rRNA maturation RNase YbeY [Coriobacteriales bacterium]